MALDLQCPKKGFGQLPRFSSTYANYLNIQEAFGTLDRDML
jgi:hypothetical protein